MKTCGLETAILNRPESGRVVPGTGGLRKLRFAPPSWGRGKSGATRVCYAFFPEVAAVYLFTIYTKQEADDLSAGDKVYFRTMLNDYRRWLKEHKGMLP